MNEPTYSSMIMALLNMAANDPAVKVKARTGIAGTTYTLHEGNPQEFAGTLTFIYTAPAERDHGQD